MATTAPAVHRSTRLHTVRVLACVLIGFARTYYLAGRGRAPLPNHLIHVHGAVFTAWVLLVVVQTALIGVRKPRLHMKLGLFGFGLAVAMVCLGLAAARNAMLRGLAPPGFPGGPESFFVVPCTNMVLFSVLVFFSWRTRYDKIAHKRLITLATLSLLDAAIDRWPFAFMGHSHMVPDLIYASAVLLVLLYDLVIFHKPQRATLFATAFILALHFAEVPLGMTAAWHHFASFAARL